jgi:hypothetical protein
MKKHNKHQLAAASAAAGATEFQRVLASVTGGKLVITADVVPPAPYNVSGGYGVEIAIRTGDSLGYPWFLKCIDIGSGKNTGLMLYFDGLQRTLVPIAATLDDNKINVAIPLTDLGNPTHIDWQLRRTANTTDGFGGGVWQIVTGSLDVQPVV